MVNTSLAISGHLSLVRVAFRRAQPPRRSFSSAELRHRNSLSALSKLNVCSGSRGRGGELSVALVIEEERDWKRVYGEPRGTHLNVPGAKYA